MSERLPSLPVTSFAVARLMMILRSIDPGRVDSVRMPEGFSAIRIHGCWISVFSLASAAAISSKDGARQTCTTP